MAKRKSKVTVSRYDSADYLKTELDMAAYLRGLFKRGTRRCVLPSRCSRHNCAGPRHGATRARYRHQSRRTVQSTVEGR